MARVMIDRDGQMYYRTALMTQTHAASFARCLAGNDSFCDVLVSFSFRAKPEKAYYVIFKPASIERQRAIYSGQDDAREARAVSEGSDYIFFWDSDKRIYWVFNPKSTETYEVSGRDCTCPDYQFRCRENGLTCKHMKALRLRVEAGELSLNHPN